MAGPTGIEPAISSVTGRRVNRYTTSPQLGYITKNRGKWELLVHNYCAQIIKENNKDT
jgi:hypothetical protein